MPNSLESELSDAALISRIAARPCFVDPHGVYACKSSMLPIEQWCSACRCQHQVQLKEEKPHTYVINADALVAELRKRLDYSETAWRVAHQCLDDIKVLIRDHLAVSNSLGVAIVDFLSDTTSSHKVDRLSPLMNCMQRSSDALSVWLNHITIKDSQGAKTPPPSCHV